MIDNILIHCSSIYKIMTEPKAKVRDAGELSETAKTHIYELYLSSRYNRRREYSSKYIEKGLIQEGEAIHLFSHLHKVAFKKNTEQFKNEYICGEPDLIEGFDVKCSWDLWTFPDPFETLCKQYYWQNMGYMALTGADTWTTVYCLVNATASLITNEKLSMWYKLGCPDETDSPFVEKAIDIEKNMIFDIKQFENDSPAYDLTCKDWHYDIPLEERIREFVVERDENAIENIYRKVEKCRIHYKTLEQQWKK